MECYKHHTSNQDGVLQIPHSKPRWSATEITLQTKMECHRHHTPNQDGVLRQSQTRPNQHQSFSSDVPHITAFLSCSLGRHFPAITQLYRHGNDEELLPFTPLYIHMRIYT